MGWKTGNLNNFRGSDKSSRLRNPLIWLIQHARGRNQFRRADNGQTTFFPNRSRTAQSIQIGVNYWWDNEASNTLMQDGNHSLSAVRSERGADREQPHQRPRHVLKCMHIHFSNGFVLSPSVLATLYPCSCLCFNYCIYWLARATPLYL